MRSARRRQQDNYYGRSRVVCTRDARPPLSARRRPANKGLRLPTGVGGPFRSGQFGLIRLNNTIAYCERACVCSSGGGGGAQTVREPRGLTTVGLA
jgi:hypothetical protein